MKGRGWYLLLNPKPVPQTQDRNTASVKAEQDTSITGLLEEACTRYVFGDFQSKSLLDVFLGFSLHICKQKQDIFNSIVFYIMQKKNQLFYGPITIQSERFLIRTYFRTEMRTGKGTSKRFFSDFILIRDRKQHFYYTNFGTTIASFNLSFLKSKMLKMFREAQGLVVNKVCTKVKPFLFL